MVEPEKPFACTIPDCGMTFTNEDHLHVHTKKHDMYLQLGIEQKAAFVADQTPTPTRFIRNCEEVGLFQDLQSVNPFDEGFKRAIETKQGILSLENAHNTTEELHTPQMFPVLDSGDATLFTSNNHKNITISRSSSDESGTIKEYETTTISKLTNEVTTISRIVNKLDVLDKTHIPDEINTHKNDDVVLQKDVHNETSVSYTNNVIKIHNNIEIIKDNLINVETTKNIPTTLISYADTVIKDASNIISKDVLLTDSNKNQLDAKMPPIMSQKSFEYVVDSLRADICQNTSKPEVKLRNRKCAKPPPKLNNNDYNTKKEEITKADNKTDDYEVIIKLPNGKQVRMKAVEEVTSPEKTKIENNTKEKLKLALANKASQKNTILQRLHSIATPVHNIVPISTGTLIPVTLVNPYTQILQKIPIAPFNPLLKPNQEFKKTVKRKSDSKNVNHAVVNGDDYDDCVIIDEPSNQKKSREDLNSRVAASRRYRVRLKETMKRQVLELKQLRESNQKLIAEKAALKMLISDHMRTCPQAHLLRIAQEKIVQSGPAK